MPEWKYNIVGTMNKLFCMLILIVFVSCGCFTTMPYNDESGQKGRLNLLNAIDDERISEAWYRMSYKVRDSMNFKEFESNWQEIAANLKKILDGEITSKHEIETVDGLQAVVLKFASETQIAQVLFVAELDRERFPGEKEVVWRFRGLADNSDKTLSFGFIPIKK